jgi:hypothetical protein
LLQLAIKRALAHRLSVAVESAGVEVVDEDPPGVLQVRVRAYGGQGQGHAIRSALGGAGFNAVLASALANLTVGSVAMHKVLLDQSMIETRYLDHTAAPSAAPTEGQFLSDAPAGTAAKRPFAFIPDEFDVWYYYMAAGAIGGMLLMALFMSCCRLCCRKKKRHPVTVQIKRDAVRTDGLERTNPLQGVEGESAYATQSEGKDQGGWSRVQVQGGYQSPENEAELPSAPSTRAPSPHPKAPPMQAPVPRTQEEERPSQNNKQQI